MGFAEEKTKENQGKPSAKSQYFGLTKNMDRSDKNIGFSWVLVLVFRGFKNSLVTLIRHFNRSDFIRIITNWNRPIQALIESAEYKICFEISYVKFHKVLTEN